MYDTATVACTAVQIHSYIKSKKIHSHQKHASNPTVEITVIVAKTRKRMKKNCAKNALCSTSIYMYRILEIAICRKLPHSF